MTHQIYPYLLTEKSPYAWFPSYKEAVKDHHKKTKEECEKYVRYFWAQAFIYEHGPDWTVIPMEWRTRNIVSHDLPSLEGSPNFIYDDIC